jgi:hypothetical protein
MNFQFYVEKLEGSDLYKEFMKENPDTFLCSAFFSVDKTDKTGKAEQQHLDFFIPKTNELFSFKLEDKIEKLPLDNFSENPERISMNVDFDFNEVETLIRKEISSRDIKTKIQKIFLSLQKKGEKYFIIGTVFISSFGIIRINIDITDNDMKVIYFDRNSFMDMIRFVKKDKKD